MENRYVRTVYYGLATLVIFAVFVLHGYSILRSSSEKKNSSSSDSTTSCPYASALQALPEKKELPIHLTPPFVLPSIKSSTSTRMTMGLRRLDKANWLSIDEAHYLKEHVLRAKMLSTQHSAVIQCMPGSDSACREVLSLVVNFLTSRYPQYFTLSTQTTAPKNHLGRQDNDSFSDVKWIHNHLTGESFRLGDDNCAPLETAARLAMEDFSVLTKDESDGKYHLIASATLFPAGWKLQERIGGTLEDLHGPVPKWKESLGCSVGRYFDHLSVTTMMERYPAFVQTDDALFQDDNLVSIVPASTTISDSQAGISPQNSSASSTTESPALTLSNIHLRRERQTFQPLPIFSSKSGNKTVLFAVHTFLTPLATLKTVELDCLMQTVGNWDAGMAKYKGRDEWADVVQAELEYRKLEKLE